jgi:2'-5' RNA ligase
MKFRLFVALGVPTKLSENLDHIIQKDLPSDLRLTKQESFHITVFFLGYVEDMSLDTIKSRLGGLASKLKPFEIVGEGIKLAPPTGPKRMVWFYFQKSRHFTNLAKTVYESLNEFTKEEFKWDPIPHITLVRSKRSLKLSNLKHPSDGLSGEIMTVNSFRLYRSQPTRSGSNYTVLANFNFGK